MTLHPSYKEKMTYREFLEARRDQMLAERNQHSRDNSAESWNYWHGRMLSYSDMLGAVDGTELITNTPGQRLVVLAAA
ncbi:MAG: hypothetical protein WA790_02560 [Sulfitobacter sp.]